MKKKLIELLKLNPEADEAAILDAVAALMNQVATLGGSDERNTKITQLMVKTGMQRTDAEHVIDQQAKEDAARKATKEAKSKK